jgi:hypothetical protein
VNAEGGGPRVASQGPRTGFGPELGELQERYRISQRYPWRPVPETS